MTEWESESAANPGAFTLSLFHSFAFSLFRFLTFAFCLVCLAGCHSNGEKLEAELRDRERELEEVRDELHKAEDLNEALNRELCQFRGGVPPGVPLPRISSAKPPFESVSIPSTVKEIVLGRQTGGYDEDRIPGDEALQVVVEPRDHDGHAIKAPGALQVTVLEILPQGVKKPLSCWDVAPEDLRRTWKSGFLSTGYYVVLPWKVWPDVEKLRVVAQFTLADGRLFEAEKDVTIHLPPEAYRKPLHPPVPTPLPTEPELPFPRKLEPESSRAPVSSSNAVQPVSGWQGQGAATPGLFDAIKLGTPEPVDQPQYPSTRGIMPSAGW